MTDAIVNRLLDKDVRVSTAALDEFAQTHSAVKEALDAYREAVTKVQDARSGVKRTDVDDALRGLAESIDRAGLGYRGGWHVAHQVEAQYSQRGAA